MEITAEVSGECGDYIRGWGRVEIVVEISRGWQLQQRLSVCVWGGWQKDELRWLSHYGWR